MKGWPKSMRIEMRRLTDWLKESNRWKHLVGGMAVGLLSAEVWAGLYAGLVAGAAMEMKDRMWGGKADLTDLLMTFVGAAIGCSLWAII